MKKCFLYLLLPSVLSTACTEDENLSSGQLVVDKTNIQAPAIGGSMSFGVYTTDSWTAATDAAWINILSPSGSGSTKFMLQVGINTQTTSREGIIRITAGEEVKEITITQPVLTPPDPVNEIIGENVNSCPSETVNLSITPVQGALSYIWYRDGVVDASSTDITLIATKNGNYTVAAVNPAGTSAVSPEKAVKINLCPPAAAGTITGTDYNECPSLSVTLSIDEIAAATAYQWYKNTQIIPGATTTQYTATESGDYTVAGINAAGTGTPSPVKTVNVVPCGSSIVDDMVGEWTATETAYLYNNGWVTTPSTFTITMEKINAATVRIINVAGGNPAEPVVTLIGHVDVTTNVLTLPCQIVDNWYSSERNTYFMAMATGASFLLNMGLAITAPIDNTSGKSTILLKTGNGTYSYVILMVTLDMQTGGSRYYAYNTKWVKK
ncbi:MAG: BACON domain-containing protein [Prevotellaceae bacterium]|jgi:hypothetical protein|nr:BACON domain-containing protein [Prevotellaceae bacterium]